MHTNSQKIAQKAYADVTKIYDDHDEAYHKKYATMAHRLPILIHTAGLTQALAFVEAKSQKTAAWKEYFNHVASGEGLGYQGGDAGRELYLASQNAPLSEYILLTKRVNDVVVWYKRFAESILKVDASQADTESVDEVDEPTTAVEGDPT